MIVNVYCFVQVKLNGLSNVRGVITRGLSSASYTSWVTSYVIQYSIGGNQFTNLTDTGNNNTHVIKIPDATTQPLKTVSQ